MHMNLILAETLSTWKIKTIKAFYCKIILRLQIYLEPAYGYTIDATSNHIAPQVWSQCRRKKNRLLLTNVKEWIWSDGSYESPEWRSLTCDHRNQDSTCSLRSASTSTGDPKAWRTGLQFTLDFSNQLKLTAEGSLWTLNEMKVKEIKVVSLWNIFHNRVSSFSVTWQVAAVTCEWARKHMKHMSGNKKWPVPVETGICLLADPRGNLSSFFGVNLVYKLRPLSGTLFTLAHTHPVLSTLFLC